MILYFVESEHNNVNCEWVQGPLPDSHFEFWNKMFWDDLATDLEDKKLLLCRATKEIHVGREPTHIFFNKRFTMRTSHHRLFLQSVDPRILLHPKSTCLILPHPPGMIQIELQPLVQESFVLQPRQPIMVATIMSDEPVELERISDADFQRTQDQNQDSDKQRPAN